MNKTIVQLIRAARAESGRTQRDLADHLGKTPAAISDLERGKVQVSASELYQIAELLNKPIEYFYGVETGNKEVEELIATFRKQPPNDRANTLQIMSMLLKLQTFSDEINKQPKNKEMPIEKAREFYQLFIPFANTINAMSKQMDEMRTQFETALKVNEVKKPKSSKTK